MLAALMYHRVGEGKHANPLSVLEPHLLYLKNNYHNVLPGDPLPSRKLSFLLTFDDASYDFYHFVFPLLVKHHLKALLAVCPSYVLPNTSVASKIRLSVPYTLAMQEGIYQEKAPFCTYEELKIMANSGHVEIASHSMTHPNLTFKHLDLQQEVVASKEALEKHLPHPITSFVYPFGKVNKKVEALVHEHYAFSFRIGSALNFSWQSPLSRFPADNLCSLQGPLSLKGRLQGGLKALWQRFAAQYPKN